MKGILVRTRGQALAEYALILMFVALVVIAVLTVLGSNIGNVFSQTVDALKDESPAGPGGDCYGSLLLPYLVGLTVLLTLVFRRVPRRVLVRVHERQD